MISISSYTDEQIKSATLYLKTQINSIKIQQTLAENTFKYYKDNLNMTQTIIDIRFRIELLNSIFKELEKYSLEIIDEDAEKINDFVELFDLENLKNIQKYIYSNNWNNQIFKSNFILKQIDLNLDWKPAKIIPEDYVFNLINSSNKFVSFSSNIETHTFTGVVQITKLFKKKTLSGAFNAPIEEIFLADNFIFNLKQGFIKFFSGENFIGSFIFKSDIEYIGGGRCFFEEKK